MKTPEQYRKETIEKICSFLREERFEHWSIRDIQTIEAAIEAAYDAGKNSGDLAMKETLENISYSVKRGYFGKK